MGTMHTSHLVDIEATRHALRVLCELGTCFELRALNASFDRGRPRRDTISGYFDSADNASAQVARIQQASGIYVTLNPVNPALLARSFNRLQVAEKGSLTSDTHIERRVWLPIDIDPQRPSGISSTDTELAASEEIARKIVQDMSADGWASPLLACSGNGWHVLYRVNILADDDGLTKRVLDRMSQLYSVGVCKVDEKVFNASRIWKLYGTLACKGDATTDRPHRWARIVEEPGNEIVTREQLIAFAGEAQSPAARQLGPANRAATPAVMGGQQDLTPFDVQDFIDRHSLDVDGPYEWHGSQGNGLKWIFRTSPMCEHHGDGPHLLQHASGAVSAACHHNSCYWNWRELRQKLEPPREVLRQIYEATPIDVLMSDIDYAEAEQESGGPETSRNEGEKKRNGIEIKTLSACMYEQLEREKSGQAKLYTTGLPGVDWAIGGGLADGEVAIVAARPSHGKSALALQMVHHMSLAGRKCLVVSEEMTDGMIAKRSISYASAVPHERWVPEMRQVLTDVAEYESARQKTLVAFGCCTIQAAVKTIEAAIKNDGIDTVFIDYMQLLGAGKKTAYENVTAASREIQKVTIANKLVTISLAQLNRDIESRDKFVPRMRDLRESGQIEQDAHVILFGVYPYKLNADRPKDEYQIFIGKNKDRETKAHKVEIKFEYRRQRFVEDRNAEYVTASAGEWDIQDDQDGGFV